MKGEPVNISFEDAYKFIPRVSWTKAILKEGIIKIKSLTSPKNFKVIGGSGSGKTQLILFLVRALENASYKFIVKNRIEDEDSFSEPRSSAKNIFVILDNIDDFILRNPTKVKDYVKKLNDNGIGVILSLRDATLYSLNRISNELAEKILNLESLFEIYHSVDDLLSYANDISKKIGSVLLGGNKVKVGYLRSLLGYLLNRSLIKSLKELVKVACREIDYLKKLECVPEIKKISEKRIFKETYSILSRMLINTKIDHINPFDGVKSSVKSVNKIENNKLEIYLVTFSDNLNVQIEKNIILTLGGNLTSNEIHQSQITLDIRKACKNSSDSPFYLCLPSDLIRFSLNCSIDSEALIFSKTKIYEEIKESINTLALINYVELLAKQAQDDWSLKSLSFSISNIVFILSKKLIKHPININVIKDLILQFLKNSFKNEILSSRLLEIIIDTLFTLFEIYGILIKSNDIVIDFLTHEEPHIPDKIKEIAQKLAFKIKFYSDKWA